MFSLLPKPNSLYVVTETLPTDNVPKRRHYFYHLISINHYHCILLTQILMYERDGYRKKSSKVKIIWLTFVGVGIGRLFHD